MTPSSLLPGRIHSSPWIFTLFPHSSFLQQWLTKEVSMRLSVYFRKSIDLKAGLYFLIRETSSAFSLSLKDKASWDGSE